MADSTLCPPHDLDTEGALIGNVLWTPADVSLVSWLRPDEFYAEAHRRIWEAILWLAENQLACDVISVAGRLKDTNRLDQIGGNPYLADLSDKSPSAAKIEEYAGRVRELAKRRALIRACAETQIGAHHCDTSVADVLGKHEQSIYDIGHDDRARQTERLGALVHSVFESLKNAAALGKTITGIPTGFEKLDWLTAGLHDGELTIVAGRPGMGKTSFVMNLSGNVASIETNGVHRNGVMVFSLEMPRDQIAARWVTCEGRVNSRKVRDPSEMHVGDWDNLMQAAQWLYLLPIEIDDTPGIGLVELAGKCRRQRAKWEREGVKLSLVVIDYLQLMRGDKSASSREQEISSLSRGCKNLSKELGVPVIALSQLNRAVETRGKEKKPQLSDLRECVTGDTVVVDAVTGDRRTVRQLASDHRGASTFGLGADWKVHRAPIVDVWSTGVKPVIRVRTKTGRVLRCTANHPLRKLSGWVHAGTLVRGDRIAVPRVTGAPLLPENGLTSDELRLLGYLISDGSYAKHKSVSYVKSDPVLVDDVRRIVEDRFGVPVKEKPCTGPSTQVEMRMDRTCPNKNPLIQWLKSLGVHGQTTSAKQIPAAVFRCDNKKVATFLGALWAGDGSVVPRKRGGTVLKFTSTAPEVLSGVQELLLRLGIVSVREPPGRNSKSKMDIANILIGEADAILRFASLIKIPGIKGEKLKRAALWCCSSKRNARVDRLPLQVTEEVAHAKVAAGMSWRDLWYRCQGKEIGREHLAKVANVLHRDDFALLAASDVLWDEVDSIAPDGEEETFDLRVPTTANFVANGLFVHNSGAIEQDADNIIFIYRDDYYNDDSDKKGIAELIVAKQRNGPTGRAFVKFNAAYTRFENLAPGEGPSEYDE